MSTVCVESFFNGLHVVGLELFVLSQITIRNPIEHCVIINEIVSERRAGQCNPAFRLELHCGLVDASVGVLHFVGLVGHNDTRSLQKPVLDLFMFLLWQAFSALGFFRQVILVALWIYTLPASYFGFLVQYPRPKNVIAHDKDPSFAIPVAYCLQSFIEID